MDPKRETTGLGSKLTRGRPEAPPEVFPRVLQEPQPITDAILVQPQVTECLAGTRTTSDPSFSVELSGRVTDSGRVVEARADGADAAVDRCLERALADVLVLPHGAGPFRVVLSRRPGGAGPGLIVDPGGPRKFE